MSTLLIVIVAVLFIGGVAVWYFFNQPLYKPGMIRAGKNLRASLAPPAQSEDSQFWQMEADIQLYHFSLGKGRNVLIVHGGPGFPHTKAWAGLAPLADEYTFHYYDQRGCGQSTRPIDTVESSSFFQNMKMVDSRLGVGAQIADIERIRHILGDEKLLIIGHSFGGFLASLYAAEFPEQVEALVLIAPANMLVMPQAKGTGLFEEVRKRLPDNIRDEFDTYMKDYLDFRNIFSKSDRDLAAMNQGFSRYYAAATNAPESTLESGEAGGWSVQAMYLSMGRRHDYRKVLRSVHAPILVIHGTDDLQSESASRMYSDQFPNAQFQTIEKAGHFPFLTQPDEFAKIVGIFLDTYHEQVPIA